MNPAVLRTILTLVAGAFGITALGADTNDQIIGLLAGLAAMALTAAHISQPQTVALRWGAVVVGLAAQLFGVAGGAVDVHMGPEWTGLINGLGGALMGWGLPKPGDGAKVAQ